MKSMEMNSFIMIRLKMNLILQVLFSENLIITANLD